MFPVTIEWVLTKNGGRNQLPPIGLYYAVAHFDIPNSKNWSVVFQLEIHLINSHQLWLTQGKVRFLVDHAPNDYFKHLSTFKIFEGPRLVANVFLR